MDVVKNYILYLVCVSLLFLFLFFSVRIFTEKNNLINMKIYALARDYSNKTIVDKDKNIDINYPRFGVKVIDEEVEDFVSEYSKVSNVNIQYTANVSKSLISMFYVINKDDKVSYKNINYSLNSSSFVSNDVVFDFNVLGTEVLEKVKVKYSTSVYDKVLNDNFKNAYVSIEDTGIYIYFDNSLFDNLLYKVFVFFPSEEEAYVAGISYDKVIAFTFDDGPSAYTKTLVDTLKANDSKATFFELGNRMKYNQDAVNYAYNNGMEVASHTYAHKNLNNLSIEEIDEEINSTNIIFNEITGGNIKYIRPPYGNANEKVRGRINTPIITWNVDTEDWLSRNSEAIYNHILEHAEDGDIILMHDIYPETIEAVKMVIPVLREMGYKITTVSELAEEKGMTLESGHIYRSFN